MAENHASPKLDEREIPVFTVSKNNCILKNIYLVVKPPSSTSSFPASSITENDVVQESEIEETLLVGRHPDCSIKLEHPSISRFHLRIHSIHSSRSLSITDLSSVHGTWISGKKVEPGVRTKLNDGDSLQLGGSSRLYHLHWVPYSRAYDTEDPFVPQLDTNPVEDTEEPIYQDTNSLSSESEQVQTLSDSLEGIQLLFSDENLCLSPQQFSPSTPLMSQDLYDPFSDEEGLENKSSPCDMLSQDNEFSGIQQCHFNEESSTPQAVSPSLGSQMASQIENVETSGMKSVKRSNLSIWSRRGKPKSVQIATGAKSVRFSSKAKALDYENYRTEPHLENHFANPDLDEVIFTTDKENCSPSSPLSKKKSGKTLKSESTVNTPFSSLDLDDDDEVFTPDKENMTPNSRLLRSMKKMVYLPEEKLQKSYKSSPLKTAVLLPSGHKERHGKILQERSHGKILQERSHGKILQERRSTNSASKSRHAGLKKEQTAVKTVADREPFKPLSVKTTSKKANPEPPVCQINTISNCFESEDLTHPHNKTTREENKRWTIVVDTGCLLNKKSRKELQLLRGLKGTSLFIPRIVVRELDCMLKRASLFTRTTEISEALEWIENCMANTKWWIHVQNSAEEGRLIPPTPPASSPPHWFTEDKSGFNIGSVPFSPYSFQEIVTPTAEDHILDCALFFKRTRNDGQLVLLSNDVTLKIKAMAEGVICETAEEFRRSLVCPFSERFLYNGSSPRGATWSCVDDAVLKEKYYPSPTKKLSKSGGVKGLKLILQHNSSFKQIAF